MLDKIRAFIQTKKGYLTAITALLTALVAWSAKEVDTQVLIVAIYVTTRDLFTTKAITDLKDTP